jgi:vacuolar protein sorting-associated protein 13A/C
LRKGGVTPVHSVELGHLVLLNVEIQDTGNILSLTSFGLQDAELPVVFKPSNFGIINTGGNSDFDVENRLTLLDASERKLNLKLNYVFAIPLDILSKQH